MMTLLLNRYVQIAIAVVLTALIVGPWQRYVGYEKEHAARLIEVAEKDAIITAGALKAFRLSENTTRSILEADQKLQDANKKLEAAKLSLKQRIKENEELRSILLPRSAVELFNESTSYSTNRGQGVQVKTNGSNDGKTSATKANLGTLIEISAENNINHLACISQVQSLQTFICDLYAADGQLLDFETCHQ